MIRKFKHKKTGAIAVSDTLKGYYRITSNNMTIQFMEASFIEGTCDWQEIQEPKYQILAFQHPENGNLYKLLPNGTYGYPKVTGYYNRTELNIPYEECLKRYPIHSVKRLSDGVIFTIGNYFETLMWSGPQQFIIGKFFISMDKIGIICTDEKFRFELNEHIILIKKSLTATVKITFSDNRPSTTQKLEKGDSLLIKF